MSGQPLWEIFLAPNKTKREQVDLHLDEKLKRLFVLGLVAKDNGACAVNIKGSIRIYYESKK